MVLPDLRTQQKRMKRRESSDAKPQIEGYFNVFKTLSEPIWDMYKEEIQPGAFASSLASGNDIAGLFSHESSMVLGSTKSGTMTLKEDDIGLFGTIDPPDTYFANGLLESLKRGDIDSASFGFYYKTYTWRLEDGWDVLEVRDLELVEVSVVKFPAFRATQIGIRSYLEGVEDIDKSALAPLCRAYLRLENNLESFSPDDKSIILHHRSLLQNLLPERNKKAMQRLQRSAKNTRLEIIREYIDVMRETP